jgi:CBS domain-containing protein
VKWLQAYDNLDNLMAHADEIGGKIGDNLRDALEFISIVRIRHQALAIEDGREPDNNVRPEDLSPFERSHLKDAFQVVSNAQKFLRFRYNAGMGRNV